MNTSDILKSIQELLPSIRSRRQEIEEARRLPRDLADKLSGTGIFTLCVPRVLGGAEAKPVEIMRAIEAVATADGSAGWCAMIGVSGNLASGYMAESGAKEIYTNPSIPSAGVAAPAGAAVRVDQGVKVSGRWSFASGITHCDWVWAGCMVMEDGKPRMTPHGPETVHVFLPVSEVAIQDTWHVSGLRGTGSNDFTVKETFVPGHRTFALIDPSGHRPEPLFQMPPVSFFVAKLACVSLGIARSALDELTEMAQAKVPSLYMDVLADRPGTQVELARVEAALGAARAFHYGTVEDMWQTVAAGRAPSKRQLALCRMSATHAVETAAMVTRTANTLGGSSSIYSSSSLQRHARDAEAITHHFTVTPHTWEESGRVLMGREPIVPIF